MPEKFIDMKCLENQDVSMNLAVRFVEGEGASDKILTKNAKVHFLGICTKCYKWILGDEVG